MKSSASIDLFVEDDRFYFGYQCRVAQEQAVATKNSRFVLTQLLANTRDNGIQFLAGGLDSVLQTRHLGGKRCTVQVAWLALRENLVYGIGSRNDHAGRDRNSF